jgi:predicted AlkP superfamily pyrophosphatase or phosphodiesterase
MKTTKTIIKLCLMAGIVIVGNGATCKVAETAIIQGVDEACTTLTSQPDPEWIYFTCAALDAAGNIIGQYTAKVPTALANDFATKHPPAAASKSSP